MFSGDNLIGVVLLGICGVVAAVLIWQITTGERLVYDGPGWLPPVLGVLMLGAMLWSFFKGPRGF
ncbi:MAG: hypothetical protein ACKOWF_06660 [Chloroflexota bacterium]